MKTIVFDFDGTLTKRNNEIWRKIWLSLDAADIDDILYDKYNHGELTYNQWSKEVEKEFVKRKVNIKLLDSLIKEIEMMENIEITLKQLKQMGYSLRILSGGIDYAIKSLLKENVKYFDDIRTNIFIFDNNGFLIATKDTNSDERGKAQYILNYAKETNTDVKDIIFIGNGNNDRFVAQTGCHTICLNPYNTNHENKNIWHTYIDNTNNLNDIIKVIKTIHKGYTK